MDSVAWMCCGEVTNSAGPKPGGRLKARPHGTKNRFCRLNSLHWISQDFRYGLRGLRQQPAFALVAVLALALGIGAATTIFSVIENVLLDPFPYTDANRVVAFYIHDVNDSRPNSGRGGFRAPEFLDYQEQNHVFEEAIGGGNEDVLY